MARSPYQISDNAYILRNDAYIKSLSVDNFEDGDLAEYDRSDSSFTTTTDRSTEGDRSLYTGDYADSIFSYPDNAGGEDSSEQQENLNYYPKRGDTIRFDILFGPLVSGTGDNSFVFWFFIQGTSPSEYYAIEFERDVGEINLLKELNGIEELDRADITYNEDVWYGVEMLTGSDKIEVHFSDVTLSTTDQRYDDGGIGFSGDGGNAFFDDIRAVRDFS